MARGKKARGASKTYIAKVAKQVLTSQCEKKEHNFSGFGLRPTYTSGVNESLVAHCTAVTEGEDMTKRNGREIIAKSMQIHGNLQLGGASNAPQQVRITLVRMIQQEKDTAPVKGDIYSHAGATDTLYSMWSRASNAGRYRVLYDRVYNLETSDNAGDTSTPGAYKIFKIKINLKDLKIRYNGTSGNDINLNGIYLLVSSSQPYNLPANANTPYLNYHGRMIYIDP